MHALAAEEHGQRLSDDELIQSVFRRAYSGGSGVARGAGREGGGGTEGCVGGGGAEGRVGGGDAEGREGATGRGGAGDAAGREGAAGAAGAEGREGAGDARVSSPAYKIAIKQCPDCKRAWQYSGGRDVEVDPAVAECAACDAVHLGSLDAAAPERTTTTVTSRKREQVLARDGYCCTVPGCRRNVGLDLHHIEYQSRGGGHELSNLTTVCDLHHRAIHFGKLAIRGTAPDRVTFEFRKPRDRRNVTDDEVPDAPALRSSSSAAPPSDAHVAASPVARAAIPPVARTAISPVAGAAASPVAGAAASPIARTAASPIAGAAISPAARAAISPVTGAAAPPATELGPINPTWAQGSRPLAHSNVDLPVEGVSEPWSPSPHAPPEWPTWAQDSEP